MGRGYTSTGAAQYSGGFRMAEVSTAVDNISMGMWFWVDANTMIVRTYNGDDSSTGIGLHCNSAASNRLSVLHGGIGEFGGSTGFSLGTWNSAIYVRSGGTAQIYLNGSALGSTWTNTPNAPNGTGASSCFGPHTYYAPSSDTTGKMAESFFYNRVLTATEIAAIGANRYSPLFFPIGLLRYIPLFGANDPEPTGSLATFGGTNTMAIPHSGSFYASRTDHPDIRYPGTVAPRSALRPRIFTPGLAR